MRKLRVVVMMDDALIPPASLRGLSAVDAARVKTEFDVVSGLRSLGHDVRPVGVRYELAPLKSALDEFQPHVCFNLVEDFDGNVSHDQHVVSYLELLKQPYTGCNPRGLTLARDKAITKKILSYHGIAVPRFQVFPLNRNVRRQERLRFPLLVKSLTEEGSVGISQASVVNCDEELGGRIAFIHERLGGDAIAEQYIEGRELYVSVLGNRQLQAFPVWELCLGDLPQDVPRIATRRVKTDVDYQKRYGIVSRQAQLPELVRLNIMQASREIYRRLNLSGYARLDLRLTSSGELFLIEANPNPQIAHDEDFADSAAADGVDYSTLLSKIVSLGMSYQPLGVAA